MALVPSGSAKAERHSGWDPATAAVRQVETAPKGSWPSGIVLPGPTRLGQRLRSKTPEAASPHTRRCRTQAPAPFQAGMQAQTIDVW